MEISKFNQMKAYLLKPKRLFTSKQNTIGGGTIQGEDLGSRSGFKDPITNDEFKKLYTKFQKDKNNIGTDGEFAKILNKKYINKQGNEFSSANIYKRRKDLGIKTPVPAGQAPPAVMEQFNKVTKYLEELIPELNKQEIHYTQEQVSSMVEKKFGIEPRYKDGFKVAKFTTDKYPIMKTLDSVETKLDNTLKNMLLEDTPLNDFWYDALAKRTGLNYRTINKYLPSNETYKVIADQGAASLKNRFNKKATHGYLQKKSFKEQLTTALELEKGFPVFTGKPGQVSSAPKTKIMEFARRSWNANRGQGDIKFYKKGSKKPITWAFGLELPYGDLDFTYKGKRYNVGILSDIDLIKKEFPEIYKNQTAINNLKRYEIVDPLNKKKKITVGELIERNQINNYQWKPTGTLDILHGVNGVKNEPFTNLSFSSRDINTLQNNISVSIDIPDNKKSEIINLIDKVASGDPLNIVTRQANISRKGAGFNTMLNEIISEIQNTGRISKKKISDIINVYTADKKKLGEELNFYCGLGGKRKLSTGIVPGATCSAEDIERGMKADAQTEEGKIRLKKVAKNFAKVFGKIIAPIDIGIEGAFALPHLLRGDAQGAIAATTAGLFGAGKDAMEQVGEKFGLNSPEYALYGAENAVQQKMIAIAGLDKLLMQNRALGIIPEESGEFKKGIGKQPQEEALLKNFTTSFLNLSKLDKGATEDFAKYYPLTADLTQKNKAISNVRNFSDEIQATGMFKNIKGPSDQKTIEGFLETDGGRSKFPILPRFDLPALRAQATDYTGMDYLDRVSDMPIDIAAQVPEFESSQVGQGIKDYAVKFGPKAAKEFFEAQGIDTEPFLKNMQPLLYKAEGGRIGFDSGTIPGGYTDDAYAYIREMDDEIFNSFKKYKAGGGKLKYGQFAYNAKRQMFGPFGVGVGRLKRAIGGRMFYAEGPPDPSKRKFLKNVGIGGGIAGGIMTGLINLIDLIKSGKKGVVATKAAESEAEKIFFDLVKNVKNKGLADTIKDPNTLKIGDFFQYKGVQVFEDADSIEVRFNTDKGAPAIVEYKKPGYEVDPDAGTSYKTSGEFDYEAQEVGRYTEDGNVDIDTEFEIIDPIENVKKIASE